MTKSLQISFLLLGLILTGCAHYQLGDSAKLPFSTLSVDTVTNSSYAPQTQARLNEALRLELAKNPKLALMDNNKGEVILSVEVSGYHREIGATDRNDTGRVRSLDLTLHTRATLRNQAGKILYAENFTTSDNFYADAGASVAESQALPLLLDRTAAKIAKAVVSVW